MRTAVALLATLLILLTATSVTAAPLAAGDTAPEFEVFDLDGNPIRSTDTEFADQPYLLKFMALWCSSCHTTLDNIVVVLDENPEFENITILSIGEDSAETRDDLRNYSIDHAQTWPTVHRDDSDGLYDKYNITTISYIVLVDAEGQIVWTKLGVATEDDILTAFSDVLDPEPVAGGAKSESSSFLPAPSLYFTIVAAFMAAVVLAVVQRRK